MTQKDQQQQQPECLFGVIKRITDCQSQKNSYSVLCHEIEFAIICGQDAEKKNQFGEKASDVLANFLESSPFVHQLVNGQCSFCQLKNALRFIEECCPAMHCLIARNQYGQIRRRLRYWVCVDKALIEKIRYSKPQIYALLQEWEPRLRFVHLVMRGELKELQKMKYDYEAKGQYEKFRDFINMKQASSEKTPLSIAVLKLRDPSLTLWLLQNGAKADIKLGIPMCQLDSDLAWSPLISRLIYATFGCRMQLVDCYFELFKILCEFVGSNGVRFSSRCSSTDRNLTPFLIAFLMPEDNLCLKIRVLETLLKATNDLCLADRDSTGMTALQMAQCYENIQRLTQTKQWLAQYLLNKLRLLSLPRFAAGTSSDWWYPGRKAQRHEAEKSLAELAMRSLAGEISELLKDQLERSEELTFHERMQLTVERFCSKSILLDEGSKEKFLLCQLDNDADIALKFGNKLSNLGIIVDSTGSTLLHVAVKAGNLAVVRYLTDIRPELLTMPDTADEIPLHYAYRLDNEKMVNILSRYLTSEQRSIRNLKNQTPCQCCLN
ncbi:hypothetical protein Ciccas_007864 [Cichlidogyrus casuarinus]|uniref:ANK_REP_REGION domain-containing protein n=1 Tax=Cichlidogyrus casuarinus TaxID=1844966 RepID=A0ABD2Q2U4_9PLAT